MAALAGFGVALVFFRPVTPFEWDEVLYQRALDHYDVAAHSPHPPGAPVFVGVAKAVRLAVRDPQLAVQGTAMLAALVALFLLGRLALRLGAPPLSAVAAPVILAVMPGYAFHANVGLSDVPATAGAVAALLALVVALERPERLPLAAGVTAMALGVRPQALPLLLPAGVAAIVIAVKGRHWKRLVLALLAGVAVSLAVWLPAILATGVARYRQAVLSHAHYLATVEAGRYFPRTPLREAVGFWLVNPLGDGQTASVFWLLAVAGAVAWWLTGRRRLVLIAAGGALLYLVVAACTMNALSAVRFALPAMPLCALLASGLLAVPVAWVRRAALTIVAVWAAGVVAWGWSVYTLRREPAPVWAALTWIRNNLDLARTTVLYDGEFTPHVEYLLKTSGFAIRNRREAQDPTVSRPPGADVVVVSSHPVEGGEVLLEKTWPSRKVRQLAFWRYGSCAVTRAPMPGEPMLFSPAWVRGQERWRIEGTGTIHLPAGSPPLVARLHGADRPLSVRRAGYPHGEVAVGGEFAALLMPGPAGELAVSGINGGTTTLAPVELMRVASQLPSAEVSDASIVPVVAAVTGWGHSFWRTDLTLYNPQEHTLPLVLQFLPSGRENLQAPAADLTLDAGQTVNVDGVVTRPEFRDLARTGALLAYVDRARTDCSDQTCGFVTMSRTSNVNGGFGGDRIGEGLPGVPATQALRPGQRALFRHIVNNEANRANVGFASWTASALVVRLGVRDAAGTTVGADLQPVPAFGHRQVPLPANFDDGTVEIELVGAPPEARLFPYVALVDQTRGTPTHLLPDELTGPLPGAAVSLPLPARLAGGPPSGP